VVGYIKIEEHVAMLHNTAQQLHSRLTFADPVMQDSVSITAQIAQNEARLNLFSYLSSKQTILHYALCCALPVCNISYLTLANLFLLRVLSFLIISNMLVLCLLEDT